MTAAEAVLVGCLLLTNPENGVEWCFFILLEERVTLKGIWIMDS